MVRLDAPAGDQQIAALLNGFFHSKFEFPDLVARPFAARLVVTLDVDVLTAFGRPARHILDAGRQVRKG